MAVLSFNCNTFTGTVTFPLYALLTRDQATTPTPTGCAFIYFWSRPPWSAWRWHRESASSRSCSGLRCWTGTCWPRFDWHVSSWSADRGSGRVSWGPQTEPGQTMSHWSNFSRSSSLGKHKINKSINTSKPQQISNIPKT